MLKKTALLLIGITYALSYFGQKTSELGLILGRSYYLGELNPNTHVGNGVGSFTFGAVFRYNLNMRYSLKAMYINTELQANDSKVGLPFNDQRDASFSSNISEFSGTIEFNFLPYQLGDKKHFFSPYLFVGLSYYKFSPTIDVNNFDPEPQDESGGSKFALPFGPGIKLNISRKLAFAAEWGFRKTGNDLIDGLENRYNDIFETGKAYDNDWFVVTGIMLTYKLTDEGPCPAYNF